MQYIFNGHNFQRIHISDRCKQPALQSELWAFWSTSGICLTPNITEIRDLHRHLDFDLFAPGFSADIIFNGYSNPEKTKQPSLKKALRAFRNTSGICLAHNITVVSRLRRYHLLALWKGPVLEGAKCLSFLGGCALKRATA